MAKKRKKLLPKKIGGVKIPKAVRRGELGKFVASPKGQRALAEALVVAGAAVMSRETLGDGKNLVGDAGHALAHGRMGQALGAAAHAFREALAPPAEASSPEDLGAPEPPAKKKRSETSAGDRPITH